MLGILCGLEAEARLARRISGAKVFVSGARPEKAREGAEALVKEGATRLLSFGLCGGLIENLPAGSLVIGEGVQSSNGLWAADAAWVEALKLSFPDAVCGLVWGSERMLESASLKQSIHARYQATIVDMESQFVAEAATKAGIPFAILRAVSDEVTFNLPEAAFIPLRENGRPALGDIVRSCLSQPSQLLPLLHLGCGTSKALGQLKRTLAFL